MLPSQSASDLRGVSAAERILRHFVADPDVNVLAPSHIIMQPFMPFMPISPLRHFDDFFGSFVGNLVGNLVGNPVGNLVGNLVLGGGVGDLVAFLVAGAIAGKLEGTLASAVLGELVGTLATRSRFENVARNPSARSGLGFFPSPFHSLGCGGF